MIRLRLLGPVELEDDAGGEILSVLSQPKRLALLAYLGTSAPAFHHRDTLLAMFWPDLDTVHARRALNQAIRFLRRETSAWTPSPIIVSRGDEDVGIDGAVLWCDAAAFCTEIAARRYAQALTLYRGDFLDGFFADAGVGFGEWVERERRTLRRAAAAASRAVSEASERAAHVTTAIASARRAVELSDGDERLVRDLLRLLDRMGDRAGAIQAYDAFARRLALEFEVAPAAETIRLIESIRARAAADGRPADAQVLQAGSRIEPAHASSSNATPPPLENGAIDRWRIEREIARGGMATVYLARDTRHNRHVALKVLRPENAIAGGAALFLNEIAVTAGLAHPHILPLIDSGVAESAFFLVTPYIDGESLRTRLCRNPPLPLYDALRLGAEIAEALDYAHRRGVLHCDIKPENVLLADGHALVADFGIARALQASGIACPEPAVAGRFGSRGYTSPEVAADAPTIGVASDIYALGCVLFELLAAELPNGDESGRTLARRRPDLPRSVVRVIVESVSANPLRRPTSAVAVLRVLESAMTRRGSATLPLRARGRAMRTAVVMSTLALATATLAAMWNRVEPPPTPSEARRIPLPGGARLATISPDGRFIAYSIDQSVAALDSVEVRVQELAGGLPRVVAAPSRIHTLEWSPDGMSLLIGSWGRSLIVPSTGGRAQAIPHFEDVICDVNSHWLPDGRRIGVHCDRDRRIRIIDIQTLDSVVVPLRAVVSLRGGSWSPDGRMFAVATASDTPLAWSVHIVHIDGTMQSIVEDSVPLDAPRWSDDGKEVWYVRGDMIRRLHISNAGRRRGPPQDVPHLQDVVPPRISGSRAQLSITRDGRHLLVARSLQRSNLGFVSRVSGTDTVAIRKLTEQTALLRSPAISPDGQWIAFVRESNGAAEVYRMPVSGGEPRQVTFGAQVWQASRIAWSRDGREIAFVNVRSGRARVWTASIEGGSRRALEKTRVSPDSPHIAWAPGSDIAYVASDNRSINLVNSITGQERKLIADRRNVSFAFSPRYSPDGRRIALLGFGSKWGLWAFDTRTLTAVHIAWWLGVPLGWHADGRSIDMYSETDRRMISTIDLSAREMRSHGAHAEWRSLRDAMILPFEGGDCISRGDDPPNDYLCAVVEQYSDAWIIEYPLVRPP